MDVVHVLRVLRHVRSARMQGLPGMLGRDAREAAGIMRPPPRIFMVERIKNEHLRFFLNFFSAPGFAAPRWGRLLPRALWVSPVAFVPRKSGGGLCAHAVTKGVGGRRAELFHGAATLAGGPSVHCFERRRAVGIYPV